MEGNLEIYEYRTEAIISTSNEFLWKKKYLALIYSSKI